MYLHDEYLIVSHRQIYPTYKSSYKVIKVSLRCNANKHRTRSNHNLLYYEISTTKNLTTI